MPDVYYYYYYYSSDRRRSGLDGSGNFHGRVLGFPAMRHLCRIAWSRSGLVAYIDDAQKVCLTWLRCVDGETWDWVPPVYVPHPSDSKPAFLCWAMSSLDLAIADELGRIQIVNIGADGSPKTQIVASAVRDDRKTAVELDKIVGVHWLQPEKNMIIPRPKSSGEGSDNSSGSNKTSSKPWESIPPLGPFHPVKTGGAFLAINGNGLLRMLVQAPSARYVEFDALIPNAQNVTHASFLPMGGESLLAVLINDNGSALMAYEITIKWDPVATWATKPDFVSLTVHPVASVSLGLSAEFVDEPETTMPRRVETPVDLGVFRSIGSTRVNAWVIYANKILKFTIVNCEESLHKSFFELFSASDPVSPAPYKVWQVMNPDVVNYESDIIDCVVQRFQVVLVHSNGTLTTYNLLENNNVLQLGESGLEFDPEDLRDASVVCLSPTSSCAAVIKVGDNTRKDTDGDREHTKSDNATAMPTLCSVRLKSRLTDKASAAKVGTTLATFYACVVFNSDQYDDLLKVSRAVLMQQPEIGKYQEVFFDTSTTETQRLLSVNLGPPDDPHKVERLMVIPSPLQRWLAFLISLGTSKGWKRTPGCYAAWSLLHLQLLAFSITWTLKRLSQKPRMEVSEASRMELHASQYHLDAILGPMKWATDFILRISQEMYDASISESPASVLVEKPNVFAAMMMSNVTRYLLRFFLRGVRSLTGASKNLAEQEARINALLSQQASMTQDVTLARELKAKLSSLSNYRASHTLKKIVLEFQSMPVKLDAFERVVVETDSALKALAASQQWDAVRRASIDSTLIRHAKLPDVFADNIIPQFVGSLRKNLLPTTDIPTMYFYDTTWLALDDTPFPYVIDGLRKRVILPTEDVQKCTRCGIETAVSNDATKATPQWLQLFYRQCVCGGSWFRQKVHSKLGTPK